MTTEELAAIEALCAAHPGPYRLHLTASGKPGSIFGPNEMTHEIFIEESMSDPWEVVWIQAFVGKANAVPALLAAYRALAAERDTMRDVVASARNLIPYAVDGTMDYEGWQVLIQLNAAVKALEAP